MVTGIFPTGRFHPGFFPLEHSPPTKPGFAKYAVDANLFPLGSSILTRATNRINAATNRNNIRFFRGEHSLGEYTEVERTGGNFPGESIPRTDIKPHHTIFIAKKGRYGDKWAVTICLCQRISFKAR